MRRLLCILLMLTACAHAQAQTVAAGIMPEWGLTMPIKGRFSQTIKIENQHFLFRDEADERARFDYAYERTDLQYFVNMRFAGNWKASAGYQLRIEEQWVIHHRPMQQVATTTMLSRFRLAHRVRLDQTVQEGEAFQFRTRYRAALEIPLSGEKLDSREFYGVVSLEPIYSIQAGTHDLENRLVLTLGYMIDRANKVEVSMDHRSDRYFGQPFRQRIWLKVGWFVNIREW